MSIARTLVLAASILAYSYGLMEQQPVVLEREVGLAHAVLPKDRLVNATTHHTNQLGDLEELTFTHKSNTSSRLLCWVLTYPKSHATKAKAVARTWGPLCDTLLFMTTEDDCMLNGTVALDLGAPESRKLLWSKSSAAWKHLYTHHLSDHEWFVRMCHHVVTGG